MAIRKPFKTGGDFYRGSNFEILHLTRHEVLAISKNTRSSLGLDKHCKRIIITDCGKYWRSRIT